MNESDEEAKVSLVSDIEVEYFNKNRDSSSIHVGDLWFDSSMRKVKILFTDLYQPTLEDVNYIDRKVEVNTIARDVIDGTLLYLNASGDNIRGGNQLKCLCDDLHLDYLYLVYDLRGKKIIMTSNYNSVYQTILKELIPPRENQSE